MAEIDHSLIGSETAPFHVEVEKGAIRKFANAIGDPNPIYHDHEAALQQGYAGLVAPPTFPVSFIPPVEAPWTRDLDRRRILAGEQQFTYARPIIADDVLVCRLVFVGVDTKEGKSGAMELIRSELIGEDRNNNWVFTNSKITVYRGKRRA